MDSPQPDRSSEWTIMRLLLIIAAVVIIIAGMRAAASVITTVFFAFVIAVAVTPLLNWLRNRGVPGWLAFILVAMVVLTFILALVAILVVSLNQFINALPGYQERIAEVRRSFKGKFAEMGIDMTDVMTLDSFQPENLVDTVVGLAQQASRALSTWGFILFLSAFMLIESIDHPAKLLKALSEKNPIPQQVISFNKDIRSYLAINAWIGALCAGINTVFLILLGVDFAILWGTLSFIMSFIPIVGFVISFLPPAFMALLEFGLVKALIVIAGFIVINTITDNIIYPRIMGKELNLTPLVVILSIFFWSWVLGPLGAILAVPIMLMIKQLILESSDESRWLAALMEPAVHED